MGQARKLCPDVVIYVETLDRFNFVLGMTQEGGPRASA